jgi:hypothetical protein
MACSPTPRGHEVCALTSFVHHYNRSSGSSFALDRILDASGSTPQPEALYVDAARARTLVIEHKTFVWPRDHFQIHRSCHEVDTRIRKIVEPVLLSDRPYLLRLSDDLRGSRENLRAFADDVGAFILARIDVVHEGKVLRSRQLGREWLFRVQPEIDREYFQPSTGLIVEFEGKWSALPPPDLMAAHADVLSELLAHASMKFRDHAASRRVLVLDPHGDLRFTPKEEWSRLLAAVTIPDSVDEIWLSFHDLITDIVCGWIHQPLWPGLGPEQITGCAQGRDNAGEEACDDAQSSLMPAYSVRV